MTIHNETSEERNARIEREEDARDSYKKAMDSHNEPLIRYLGDHVAVADADGASVYIPTMTDCSEFVDLRLDVHLTKEAMRLIVDALPENGTEEDYAVYGFYGN